MNIAVPNQNDVPHTPPPRLRGGGWGVGFLYVTQQKNRYLSSV
jgi:hypothetical protein